MTTRITQNNLQPYFYFTISGIVDLTGASFTCTMLDENDVAVINNSAAGCYITDTVTRQAEYRWQSGDTVTVGTFRIYFTITPTVGDPFNTDNYTVQIISSGEDELLTLTDVEAQVRYDLTDMSEHVIQLIQAVREQCESITRRSLKPKTETLVLDAFPSGRSFIEIKNPPLRKVNSITYIDTDGVEQTLSDTLYRIVFDKSSPLQPSRIIPVYGQEWPIAQSDISVVNIEFVSGYGTVTIEGVPETITLPKAIKQWMLINVANLLENTETIVVGNANRLSMVEIKSIGDGLLANYRVYGW